MFFHMFVHSARQTSHASKMSPAGAIWLATQPNQRQQRESRLSNMATVMRAVIRLRRTGPIQRCQRLAEAPPYEVCVNSAMDNVAMACPPPAASAPA